jgi:hypothetical protein
VPVPEEKLIPYEPYPPVLVERSPEILLPSTVPLITPAPISMPVEFIDPAVWMLNIELLLIIGFVA